MANKQSINAFQRGMVQDIDILNQSNDTYRYSMGGRLVSNDNGTYSWEVENGNKVSFQVAPRNGTDGNTYTPIGNTGNNNIRVLFLTDAINGNSEIGLFSIDKDGIGSYITLFNDQDDPNGDKLNFNVENQIEARFLYENDSCIRVYWVDGVKDDSNQPRVFTFSYDRSLGNPSNVNAYSPSTNSVHAINSQSEYRMGIIKFDRTINGDVLSGVYQYTYRLTNDDGYKTPWYPVTRKIFVTTDAISNINWNKYEMEAAGLTTSKGNRLEIKGVDTRYDNIEVAYLYYKTDSVVDESNIFLKTAISGTTMTVDHISNNGEPVLVDEITAIFSGIRAAKTLNIKDSTLYYGNVIEGLLNISDTESILQNVTVKPTFKDMRSDEKNVENAADRLNPPVTHAPSITGTTTKQLHDNVGGTETYNIIGDYTNYKGTQVSNLYVGYFRGETYRFAIVFYDKLGFPSFATHLCDIAFPHQSQNTFTAQRVTSGDTVVNVAAGGGVLPEGAWPTNNFGEYTSTPVTDGENTSLGDYSHIRIMGLEVSGIDISSIANEISGFKIVRTELDQTILGQGLLMPCVRQDPAGEQISRPLPFPNQEWHDRNQAGPDYYPVAGSNFGDIELYGPDMADGDVQGTSSLGNTRKYTLRPYLSVFYMPDSDFDFSLTPTVQTQDRLKLVGGCFQNNDDGGPLTDDDQLTWFQQGAAFSQIMQKFYYSKNDFHATAPEPYPQYLDEAGIEEAIIMDIDEIKEDYSGSLDLYNSVEYENGDIIGNISNDKHQGLGKPNTIYYRTGNFGAGLSNAAPYYRNNRVGNIGKFAGSWICNYTRPNANPYGGLSLSSLETSIFFSTGHFQPVNNGAFSTPADNIFDGIEVWGGDCYLDYFGFARIYGKQDADAFSAPWDYAIGVTFPLESKLQHSLRQAPSQQNPIYTDTGTRSHQETDSPGISNWPDGVFYKDEDNNLLEEFNLAQSLLLEEITQFYNPKPFNFKDNTRYPVRWRYTPEKFYGDPTDTWRIFQVNDFKDLNGEYGEITSSLYIFNQIYSWQISAFGRLRASDRALIESANAGTLTTGIGDKLDGIDYISTKEGNQHQWSLFSSGNAAYWIDVNMRAIMRFAQDGRKELSDDHSLHNFSDDELRKFENLDNPAWLGGIIGTFDHGNGDAIWSMVYDEYMYLSGNYTVNSTQIGPGDYHENNTTLFINFLGNPTEGLMFPQVESSFGPFGSENNNSIHYVCMNDNSLDMLIFNINQNGLAIPIGTLLPGNCYRVFRPSNDAPWEFEQCTREEISPEPFSFSFNEKINAFQGFHPYRSSFLMSHKHDMLSYSSWENIGNDYYIHDYPQIKNRFYGQDYKAILSPVLSEAPMIHKIFDSLRVNCNEEGYERLERVIMDTETQSYFIDLVGDTRKKYLEDILRFPLRTKIQDDRTRGKHIRYMFEFLNNSYKPSRMTNLVTFYRTSNRV
jgi:hypothetical protein